MPEPIMTVAAISAGIPAAVKLYELIRDKKRDPELEKLASQLLSEILQWQGRVGELQGKVIALQEERGKLSEQLAALKQKEDRERELVRGAGVIFRWRANRTELEPAPYCQPCWENNGNLVPLVLRNGTLGRWSCPACKRSIPGTLVQTERQLVEAGG